LDIGLRVLLRSLIEKTVDEDRANEARRAQTKHACRVAGGMTRPARPHGIGKEE